LIMYVGTKFQARSDDDYRVLAQLGVEHIHGYLPGSPTGWTTERLTEYREHVESFGLELDMLHLPFSARDISEADNPNVMLGKSPERDREIDFVCQAIRQAAGAGIPALKYNLTLLGVVSTDRVEGRGGSSNRAFSYEKAKEDPPLTIAGPVNADMMWERIGYFVERIIPVADEYGIRMACHPHDPGMPAPFRGVERVLGSVDGLKRFVGLSPSEYHGLLFCQGCVEEMLEKPGEEIYDIIRWFASRNRIFAVDFRNIRGGFGDFMETFPDEGDIDMLRAARAYKECGYQGMLMPDHVPVISGENPEMVARAFGFGYIRALIQACG